MGKRWLLNLALIALIGALVLLAVYQPGNHTEPATSPLTSIPVNEVTRLRLVRPKQPEVLLVRHDGHWRLDAPRRARANGFRADALAGLAAAPATLRFAAKPDELGKYGLDRPIATLFLNDVEIRFGAMHPLRNEIYVLHDGQVQLVSAATFHAVTAPVDDLLSPALLDGQAKIISLHLPGFSLRQNAQGAWERRPGRPALSSDRVNRFVDEWRQARALSVAPARQSMPRERVEITVAVDDRKQTLVFGIASRKPELVLIRLDEKLEYHFPDEAASRLLELEPDREPTTPANAADSKTAN